MTACIDGCRGAYDQNKIETYNALLKVKSPGNPELDRTSVKVATCCCCPLKCLQGLTMVVSGIVLWPLPCTVCRIHTHHQGSEIHLKKAYPYPRKTETPWHYKMEASYEPSDRNPDGKHILEKGNFESVRLKKDENVEVKTSLTGYRCIEAGLRKMMRLIPAIFCCDVPPTDEDLYVFAENRGGPGTLSANRNNECCDSDFFKKLGSCFCECDEDFCDKLCSSDCCECCCEGCGEC